MAKEMKGMKGKKMMKGKKGTKKGGTKAIPFQKAALKKIKKGKKVDIEKVGKKGQDDVVGKFNAGVEHMNKELRSKAKGEY